MRAAAFIEDIAIASNKLVEGISALNQMLAKENQQLRDELSKTQAQNARLEMEIMTWKMEVDDSDETIAAILTPRYGR